MTDKIVIPPQVLKEIENIIIDISKRQQHDFSMENSVLSVYSQNPKMQPRECAEKCNLNFGMNKNGHGIISIFKRCKLGHVNERERLFILSEQLSNNILECLGGNLEAISKMDSISSQLDQHTQLRRITLIYFFNNSRQLTDSPCYPYMMRMNRAFAGECLDSILTLIKTEYLLKTSTDKSKSIEEYERELFRLEASLKRTDNMLARLQDEFEDRLEENKLDEQANLISMLNSPKYGYILDLLSSAQRGFKQMRKQNIDVPFEISTMPTLVRKLLEFVEDCGIERILEVDEQIEVSVLDVDGYIYEGTPFANEHEIKRVLVTSSGWEIKEKGIIISNPVVKEIEREIEREIEKKFEKESEEEIKKEIK